MFSTTTTESSITSPMAIARPPRDMRFNVPPKTFRKKNVPATVKGRLTAATMVMRAWRKKRNKMTTANVPPMRMASSTLAIDSFTNSARS